MTRMDRLKKRWRGAKFQCASCGSLKGENVLALGGPNSARAFIRCVECRTEIQSAYITSTKAANVSMSDVLESLSQEDRE